MAVVAATHTPAAQVVRRLMRKFIALHEIPNQTTVSAMQSADRGEGTRFDSVMTLLIEDKPLPPEYKDHPLKAGWKHHRDSHLEPDWLLIYLDFSLLFVK